MNTGGKNALVLLVGVSGCGKSTWGKKFAQDNDLTYLSSDELRGKFGKDESDQTVSGQVFPYMYRETYRLLEEGKSVLIDATNLTRKDRKKFLKAADTVGAYKVAVVFELNRDTLIARQEARAASGGRRVPDYAIDRMIQMYQKPDDTEFNRIIWK